jgi:Protein of unknown function (DUF2786)
MLTTTVGSKPLIDQGGITMTDNREKTLDKIRALLSKTTENGCTEEEHFAALAKARALMDAYEVTEADLQLAREEAVILRREPPGTKDPHNIKFFLTGAVGKFTDCRAWRDGKSGLVFCGLPADARFATWLLDHLASFVQAELASYLMGNLAAGFERRRIISGFVGGATSRIAARLDELCVPPPAASATSRALVVAKKAVIKAKLDELGICLTACRSQRQQDGSSRAAGQAAGDRASFGRPVSGQAAALRITAERP